MVDALADLHIIQDWTTGLGEGSLSALPVIHVKLDELNQTEIFFSSGKFPLGLLMKTFEAVCSNFVKLLS